MSSSSPNTDSDAQTPVSDTPEATHSAQPQPAFGWTTYAERINGRFAMVGFIGLLILELFTHQDFLTWVGFHS